MSDRNFISPHLLSGTRLDAPRRTIEEALDSMTLTFFERYPSVSAVHAFSANGRVCVAFTDTGDVWAPTFGEALQEWYRRRERRDRLQNAGEREYDSWVMRRPEGSGDVWHWSVQDVR